MLFSMIVCIGGFIFSACFCLVDMSVPFNPLLTQGLVQTGLRLTRKERECVDKAREHLRIMAHPLPLRCIS